ncbi:hypothetical protein NM09_11755 [Vibrio caribbeanicus]|uniref:Uncharacterized protein n=1 Tax=Vibrio caribbeanicus TaxID=701175 RepID=A0ACC4NWD5_9VIBR|nr:MULTISPECIES: DUF2057 domain-containing protein [Vibrio]KHD24824.1 hypothetical protein NM09_11755 [Vibrio caribbeanicus]KHT40416.1 hypothetical protein RJ47_15905 [Vibrio sinaloensis]
MKALIAITMLLVSNCLYAATLMPKKGTSILFIDGVKVEEKRDKNTIEPGRVQVVIDYNQKLKDSSKDRVFNSSPFVVSFDAPNTDIVITPPKMYTYDQASQAFQKQPKWRIETVDGKAIPYTQEVLDRADGFMPYFDMPERVAKHNEARGIVFGASAALAAKAAVAEQAASAQVNEKVKSEAIKPLDTNNLEQLKAWYVKASKQERKEFRRWMIDQE